MSEGKKILIIHIAFPGQFQHFIKPLLDNGYEIQVITFSKDYINSNLDDSSIKFHFLTKSDQLDGNALKNLFPETNINFAAFVTSRLRYSLTIQTYLEHLKRDQNYVPDIVLSHEFQPFSLFVKTVYPNCCLITRNDVYHRPENGCSQMVPEDRALANFNYESYQRSCKTYNFFSNSALLNSDKLFCATEFERTTFPNHSKIKTIFDGIDTKYFSPEKTWPTHVWFLPFKDHPYLLFATRSLEPVRGLGQFLRSIKYLVNQHPELHYVIVGNTKRASYGSMPKSGKTWLQTYREILRDELPWDRIHCFEYLKQPYLCDLRSRALVNIYLTYNHVLSWSLIETMSMGLPIVASKTVPVCEVIEDRVSGLLVEIDDPEAIADGVTTLIKDPELAKKLGQQARKKVTSQYDIDSCVTAFLDFLSS